MRSVSCSANEHLEPVGFGVASPSGARSVLKQGGGFLRFTVSVSIGEGGFNFLACFCPRPRVWLRPVALGECNLTWVIEPLLRSWAREKAQLCSRPADRRSDQSTP